MSAHTPGPWVRHFYGRDDLWVRTAMGAAIVQIGFNQPEREANANLIAAAPDLLAACEALLHRSRACGEEMPWDGRDGPDPEIVAKAAIAKAQGTP